MPGFLFEEETFLCLYFPEYQQSSGLSLRLCKLWADAEHKGGNLSSAPDKTTFRITNPKRERSFVFAIFDSKFCKLLYYSIVFTLSPTYSFTLFVEVSLFAFSKLQDILKRHTNEQTKLFILKLLPLLLQFLLVIELNLSAKLFIRCHHSLRLNVISRNGQCLPHFITTNPCTSLSAPIRPVPLCECFQSSVAYLILIILDI